jgi:hypothetical protein
MVISGSESNGVDGECGRTEAGWVYTGQGKSVTNGSMAASMAPATRIVRSLVDVRTHISLGSTARRNPKWPW